MKHIRRIFAILLLVFVMVNTAAEAFAADTGLSLDTSYPENSQLPCFTEEPRKFAISCFDISENGEFAVGSSDGLNCTVCVYMLNGDFQYGFSFKHKGSFGIKYVGDNIIIYRDSDKLISVAPSGKIESVSTILNANEYRSDLRALFYPKQRIYGDTEYILKSRMGSHCQLVMRDINGEETVLYDATKNQRVRIILSCFFVGMIGFILIKTVESPFAVARRMKNSAP